MFGELIRFLISFFILFLLAYVLIWPNIRMTSGYINDEKNSAYECGFSPFSDIRGQFDVQFYLITLLFLLFDFEVMFLIPWCVSLSHIGLFGFSIMFIFLILLVLGLLYEWSQGALDWE